MTNPATGNPPEPAIHSFPTGSDRWNMSDERQFFENLLSQRFNFFLVFVGLVAAGFVSSDQPAVQIPLLIVGSVVSVMLTMTLGRAQDKLETIMRLLYADKTHPAAYVNDHTDGKSRFALIGRVIPRFLTGALIAATIVEAAWSLVLSA